MSTPLNKRLKIAYFASFAHPQGTYFRYHNYAKSIRSLGHDVTVFATDISPKSDTRTEVRDGVRYHIVRNARGYRLWGNFCNPITCVRRLFETCDRYDVAHLWQPFPSAGLSWYVNMDSRARVRLYDWDDLWVNGLIKRGTIPAEGRFQRAVTDRMEHGLPRVADHMTTVSHMLRDMALERGARGVSIIHHGFTPYEIPPRVEARRHLKLKEDAFYVGFMGRTLNELTWIFDSLRLWCPRLPQLRLAICGANLELLEPLMHGVRDQIDVLGQLGSDDVKQFAAAIDLGLLPLQDDAFNRSRLPIKLLDHVGAGVPLLCSDVGETALIARTMPWVKMCGKTRAEWIKGFGDAVQEGMAGKAPPVDLAALRAKWAWENKAVEMVAIYEKCLSQRGRI